MKFFNRQVVLTTLDEIPRAFRALPGCIAMTTREFDALRKGDGTTFKSLASIAEAEDAADARRIFVTPKRPQKIKTALTPSSRLISLAAVTKSWHR